MERREHEYKGTRLLNSCNSLSLSLSFVCSLFLCLCRGKKAVTLAKTQEKLRYFLDSTQKYCWIWAKTVLCILPAFPPPLSGFFCLDSTFNAYEPKWRKIQSWSKAGFLFLSYLHDTTFKKLLLLVPELYAKPESTSCSCVNASCWLFFLM